MQIDILFLFLFSIALICELTIYDTLLTESINRDSFHTIETRLLSFEVNIYQKENLIIYYLIIINLLLLSYCLAFDTSKKFIMCMICILDILTNWFYEKLFFKNKITNFACIAILLNYKKIKFSYFIASVLTFWLLNYFNITKGWTYFIYFFSLLSLVYIFCIKPFDDYITRCTLQKSNQEHPSKIEIILLDPLSAIKSNIKFNKVISFLYEQLQLIQSKCLRVIKQNTILEIEIKLFGLISNFTFNLYNFILLLFSYISKRLILNIFYKNIWYDPNNIINEPVNPLTVIKDSFEFKVIVHWCISVKQTMVDWILFIRNYDSLCIKIIQFLDKLIKLHPINCVLILFFHFVNLMEKIFLAYSIWDYFCSQNFSDLILLLICNFLGLML